jgi:hypothetical protein
MAQPVYPQFRKYPCVPALTLRANFGSESTVGERRKYRGKALYQGVLLFEGDGAQGIRMHE